MNTLKEDGAVMSAGTGGFSSSASVAGPVAGYDPVMKLRSRIKNNIKIKRAKPPGQPGQGLVGDSY